MDFKSTWALVKAAARGWSEDKVPRLGAALAFYSALSLAPLLVISIAIAAVAFPDEASARTRFVAQIQGLVGKEGGEAIRATLEHAKKPGEGVVSTILGVATLLLGASGVFGSLQDSLNTIWEVQPKPGRGLWGVIKDRFLSLSMVLGTGFLLLVSLVVTTVLEAISGYFHGLLPGWAPVLQAGNLGVTFGVITLLFAMIYKYLPDATIAWSDVWPGSLVTALLFTVGKFAIGLYLGRSTIGSAYGAAGSLVVLLVWIYYSAQILFFGAEFTKVYAAARGSRIKPARDAEPVTAEARAQQGIPRRDDPRPVVAAAPSPARVSSSPAAGPSRRVGLAEAPSRLSPGPRGGAEPSGSDGHSPDGRQGARFPLQGAAIAAGVVVLLYVRSRLARGDDGD